MMLTWGKSLNYEEQFSNWVHLDSAHPEFDFVFDRKTDIQHWLLCLRLRLGIKERPIEMLATTGMQIIDAGSFVKKDQEIWKKREKDQKVVRACGKRKRQNRRSKKSEAKENAIEWSPHEASRMASPERRDQHLTLLFKTERFRCHLT